MRMIVGVDGKRGACRSRGSAFVATMTARTARATMLGEYKAFSGWLRERGPSGSPLMEPFSPRSAPDPGRSCTPWAHHGLTKRGILMTRARAAVLLLAALLAAACTGGQAPTPTPVEPSPPAARTEPPATPTPSPADPTVAPSFPAPDEATVRAAAAALDGLVSYRYVITQSQGGIAAAGEGVVINGAEPRTRLELTAGGMATGEIQIGSRRWWSIAGSSYQRQDVGSMSGNDPWTNPVIDQLGGPLAEVDAFVDAGVEVRDGVTARHVHGTADATAPEQDPMWPDDPMFPSGPSFIGTVDAWISVDDDRLVAALVQGSQSVPSFSETAPAPTPMPMRIELRIDNRDDPANVVEEPPTVEPTPAPAGDPAAAALIAAIGDGLVGFDSYVFELSSDLGGYVTTTTITVNNRPKQAARWVADASFGFGLSILVIGRQSWTRSGSDPWEKARKGNGPTCGTAGESSSEYEPCTFERMIDLGAGLDAIAGTFLVVATDETVEGIPCTHVRSVAGIQQGDFGIPGTTDLWIANAGGYLVQDTFNGQGFVMTMRIGRINDPANRLEPPTN